MNHTYMCRGMRNVLADNIKEAAGIFAGRLARKKYGRTAYARTLNITSWTSDYETLEFSSFIGTRSGPNETSGSNINFTVHKK